MDKIGIRKIEYKSLDGINLKGVLSIPKESKGFVLMMHGITVDKDEWQGFYKELSSYLYEKGYASLRFDFRGHGESGGTQLDVSIQGEIYDIKASIQQIRKIWNKKIAFLATSFSAGPAILTIAENHRIASCLILIAPVIDYENTFLKPQTDWAKASFNEEAFKSLPRTGYILLDGYFKLSEKLINEFRSIKPYRLLNNLNIPILLIHGKKDSMVPFQLSRKYFKPKQGSKFLVIENADHGYPEAGDETGTSPQSQINKHIIFQEIFNFLEGVYK